jgi:hypothetical protein
MLKNKKDILLIISLAYFVMPSIFVAIYAPKYELMLKGFDAELPSLTGYMIHAYSFSFTLMFFGSVSLLIDYFCKNNVWFNIALFFSGAYAIWIFLVYLGLRLPIAKLEMVVS